ncbi:hypothetical protein GCM10027048_37650 [Hymenobacter coalescens]
MVTATIQVVPGEVLTVVAGGPGLTALGNGDPGAGGYNGGGMGGRATGVASFQPGGSGGGGATDLRRISGATAANPLEGGTLASTLGARLVVAGGAGQGSSAGTNGTNLMDGRAGTSSAGGAGGTGAFNGWSGSLGEGGAGATGQSAGGWGGGGGYYGGGGGAVNGGQYGAGGGGSSYVQPTALVSGTTPTFGLRPTSIGGAAGTLTLTPVYSTTPTLTSFTPTTGPAGTSVTLNGTNLTGTTAIAFAGSSNNTVTTGFTVNAAGTQITGVIVPAGATSGAIRVTTPSGTATSATSFNVTIPAPTITGFSPSSGIAGTTSVVITGTNFSGTPIVRFYNAFATNVVVNSSTQMTVTVPTGARTDFIHVTTPGGGVFSPTQFRVSNCPVPFTFTVTPYVQCVGRTSLVNVTSTDNEQYVFTLERIGGVAPPTNSSSPMTASYTFGAGGLANGYAQYRITASANGCSTSQDFTLTIQNPPAPSAAPATRCGPGSVTLTATGAPAGATYEWFNSQMSGSPLASGPSFTTPVLPVGQTTYGVRYRESTGSYCDSDFRPVTVTVTSGPATPTATGSPSTVAANQPITLSVTNPDANLTYTWTGPGLQSTTGATVTARVTSQGTAQYTVVASNSSGCSSTASAPVSITVQGAPNISSFTPVSGPVGTAVTINGNSFTGASAVRFNGTSAAYTVVSATQITTSVPTGATSGSISVTTPIGTVSSLGAFTVTAPAPTIASFTPASGPVNMRVDITGTNFTGVSSVTFTGNGGPVQANISTANAGVISVNVPVGAISGPIRVTTPGGTAVSSTNFTVQPDPVVYSFTPASGAPGTQVVITGANFTGAQIVSFNSTFLFGSGFVVNSDNQITATVPTGATTGPIGVNTGGSTGFSATNFTVTAPAPTISSFTPASGPAGTSVTLTGANFTGATAVRFNSLAATFTVNSATQITTSVPTGATSGLISVTTPGGTGSSASSFTVPVPNAAPTALTLSNSSVAENQPNNVLVGSFFATDPNPSDTTHTYTLVTGVGSGGNGNFVISGRRLLANTTFDFETQASYSIRVRTTDQGGLWLERTFTVTVTNVADVPTITAFTPSSGSGGTSVTVTGTNLFNLTGISVNNVAVTTPFVNDPVSGTQVWFDVPATATTGPIRITTTAGTATSAPNFVVGTAPAIFAVSPASGPAGSAIALHGAGFTGTAGLIFTPGGAAAFTVVSDSLIRATVPAGLAPGLTQLTISGPNGSATAPGGFTVVNNVSNLVVSSAQTVTGTYNNVTVTATGAATLTGNLTVQGTLLVQAGGLLDDGGFLITGLGSFALASNATLVTRSPQGISATGSTGGIQVSGTRTFSRHARYRYSGTAAQNTGSGLPAQVRELWIANGSPVTLTQPVAIRGMLTLAAAGNLVTGGQPLLLLSDADTTALVVNAGTGLVQGTATVQRYLSPSLNAGLGYRHLTAPVQGTSMADLTTPRSAPVANPAYNTSATPGTVTPFPTVFGYDQARVVSSPATTYSAFDKGWFSPASTTDPLLVGRGYTVEVPGNETVDFQGTLTTGTQALSFSRVRNAEAGWQLVGNPYPAPLDWSRVTAADRAGLDAAMYVYESTGRYIGRYRSYANGIGTSPILPLGQAFFVRVADTATTGSLTLRNAHRLTAVDATPLLRATADTRPQLQLALAGAGSRDEAYLYTEAGASAGFEAAFDARKLPNSTGLNLALLSGSTPLAISGLAPITAPTIVPLQVSVPTPGVYTLEAVQLLNMAAGATVSLRDAQTGQDLRLTNQTAYRFSLAGTTAGSRFSLVLRPGSVTATTAAPLAHHLSVHPTPAQESFTVQLPAAGLGHRAEAALYNSLGQLVLQRTLQAGNNGLRAEFTVAHLPNGVYTLRLALPDGTQLTKRVIKQ